MFVCIHLWSTQSRGFKRFHLTPLSNNFSLRVWKEWLYLWLTAFLFFPFSRFFPFLFCAHRSARTLDCISPPSCLFFFFFIKPHIERGKKCHSVTRYQVCVFKVHMLETLIVHILYCAKLVPEFLN